MNQITWNPQAENTFKRILNHLPQFHRSIAERLVKEKAEVIAKERSLTEVSEKILIQAFYEEVPPAFRQMMERLFNQLGINYTQESEK